MIVERFTTSPWRAEVEAEAERMAAAAGGWKGLNRKAVVEKFAGRVPASSAYAWIAEMVKKRTAPRPACDIPGQPLGLPPVGPVLVADSAPSSPVVVPVAELVAACLQAAKDVQAVSRGPDGKPRNGKMLLRATDTLRRCLETAVRLQEAVNERNEQDELFRRMMAEVKKLAPDTARAIFTAQLGVIEEFEARAEGST